MYNVNGAVPHVLKYVPYITQRHCNLFIFLFDRSGHFVLASY